MHIKLIDNIVLKNLRQRTVNYKIKIARQMQNAM